MNRKTRRGASGFSLIEAAVATVIIAVGVTALMISVAAGTRTNDAGRLLTQGVFLVQEIREWTLKLPFSDPDVAQQGNPPGPDGSDPQVFVDDLDDLLNVTYSPPRDGQGQPIADMVGWSQAITLSWRNPDNLSQTIANGASDIIHVQVAVSNQGKPVVTTGWLVSRKED